MRLQHAAPFIEAIRDQDQRIRALCSGGTKILGYFCTYTPVEIIHASGFLPLRIMGGSGQVREAYSLTPNFICPYMRLIMDKALRGEYGFLSGLVQGYTCDVACGLMNIWKENIDGELYHSMPLPYNDNSNSREFFRSAIMELVDKLAAIGGKFSEVALEQTLNLYGSIRTQVINLYHMRYERRLPLSASAFLYIVQAGFVTPAEDYLKILGALSLKLQGAKTHETDGIPVLISGSLIEEPRILEILEETGLQVVADDLCTGIRNFHPPMGQGKDPIERLIDRYLHRLPCPARVRAKDRTSPFMEMIRRSGAKGVVFLLQKFCTPHLADYPMLSNELKKAGIPNILIEIEESGIMEGQLRTRLGAFLEMLRG
jgi:benzoyl-CoA reductase/2-hydroxyglutaryl-CoA dehydratase subunit BcrC/BadD/HgdB